MPFAIATLVSIAIVLVAPFMGQLQSSLRRSMSTRAYVLLFGVGVLVAIGAAVIVAVVRIRDGRRWRLGLLGLALMCGAAYLWANGTPYPEVNAVERVHFVEYGLIAFLFYRAWRPAGDVSLIVLPLLASFTVGTCDEFLQWFIPVRVGEAHDVFMNLAAIVCGLMFAFALQPPPQFSWRASPASLRRMGFGAAGAWLVFAAFVSQVHLGREVVLDSAAIFHSHYTADELLALQGDRARKWSSDPPRVLRRLSQEDQYLDEGIWHIRRRNVTEPFEAFNENLILERFFAPVLDIPTYAAPAPSRWPPEQRRAVETAIVGAERATLVSTAEPYPIVTWPRATYWAIVAAVAVLFVVMPMFAIRRENVEPGP